jgi:hypothetical protein
MDIHHIINRFFLLKLSSILVYFRKVPLLFTDIDHSQNHNFWLYPKITVSLKILLFYPNPKGDKRNFKWVSVQKWDIP